MKRALLFVMLMLVATSCSGPHHPIEIGVKEIDTDVLIGPRPSGSPPPSTALPPVGFPGFVQPPLPRFPTPGPTTEPLACPSADPLSRIEHPVATTATAPPVANIYGYRNKGTYSIGALDGSFPARSSRIVEHVAPAGGGEFRFDVAIEQPDGSETTTTYHVAPVTGDPTKTAGGMYIQQIVTVRADKTRDVFAPTPELLLIPFPASVGATWDARGIDPLATLVMQYSGKITQRATVDACGRKLEAWQVDVTDGSVRGPSSDFTFSATIDVAPQYGGISLLDTVRQKGTDAGTAIDIANTARISEEPDLP